MVQRMTMVYASSMGTWMSRSVSIRCDKKFDTHSGSPLSPTFAKAKHPASKQYNVDPSVFRLDALASSVIATATWLGGWVAGCHTPVLYQNR